MTGKRVKPLPFGKHSHVTKFGSERLKPVNLPHVTIRELVMISPEGRAHIFTSTPYLTHADTSLQPVFNLTLVEMLSQGWMAIANSSVRMPVVLMLVDHDMGLRQLHAFRTVLERYASDFTTILIRAYSLASGSYTNVGQFRTLQGAELGARGG